MTYKQAKEKLNRTAKEQPRNIHFLVGKNDDFEVFSGWDGRDRALANGFRFPKYSMSRCCWTTNCDYNYYKWDWCD